jgi:hypothetical protein
MLLLIILGYIIIGYLWLFYWWLLLVIFGAYSISAYIFYWCLLLIIILVAISCYSISGY